MIFPLLGNLMTSIRECQALMSLRSLNQPLQDVILYGNADDNQENSKDGNKLEGRGDSKDKSIENKLDNSDSCNSLNTSSNNGSSSSSSSSGRSRNTNKCTAIYQLSNYTLYYNPNRTC